MRRDPENNVNHFISHCCNFLMYLYLQLNKNIRLTKRNLLLLFLNFVPLNFLGGFLNFFVAVAPSKSLSIKSVQITKNHTLFKICMSMNERVRGEKKKHDWIWKQERWSTPLTFGRTVSTESFFPFPSWSNSSGCQRTLFCKWR